MTRSVAEANIAISRIRRLPYGVARSTAANAELERITAEGPAEARAYALFAALEGYVWGGEVDKAFLPFTQMLRWWDAHPEYFDADDQHSLFWSFKWMVAHLREFPGVPAEQIDATLADMQRRYALAGNGMNAVTMSRFKWAQMRGAPDTESLYTEWTSTPRDDFSQCEACDPGDRAAYLYETGRYAQCVELIEQTLTESPSCATEPGDMLSYLQLSYVHLGDARAAARTHRAAMHHLPTDTPCAAARGRHLEFLARTGNTSRALHRLAEDQRLCTETDTPYDRWQYLRAVGAAMGLLRSAHGDHPVAVHEVPAATVAELDDWARAEALTIATQFDARNGSTAVTDRTWALWNDPTTLAVDLSVFDTDSARQTARAALSDPARTTNQGSPASDSRASGSSTATVTPMPGTAGSTGDPANIALEPAALGPEDLVVAPDPGSPAALLDEAEHTAPTDQVRAARLYVEAADALRAAGRLDQAGFAHAEAAMLASGAGDDEGACERFASAVSLLRAAGTPPLYIGPVVRAWSRRAQPDELAMLAPYVEALADELARPADFNGVAPDLAERERSQRAVEVRRLRDTGARIAATLGDPAAEARAESVAEEFARAGEYTDAAHAFWLLGTLRPDGSDAVYALESAVEGFELAHERDAHRAAGNELVGLLRRLGRTEDAERLAVSLSEN